MLPVNIDVLANVFSTSKNGTFQDEKRYAFLIQVDKLEQMTLIQVKCVPES